MKKFFKKLLKVSALLVGFAGVAHAQMPASCIAGTNIYYISSGIGSDSNTQAQARSKSTPWAHQPYMANSTGNAHSYSHTPGDCFVFRGGDTWTAASFPITPLLGGNSSVSDYYGVDLTWPSSGWTRPIFDAQQTQIGHFFTLDNADYYTIDNFEMKNQDVGHSFNSGASEAIRDLPGGSVVVVHTLVENIYIHDFMTNSTISNSAGAPWYSAGGLVGYMTVQHSIINDSGGFGFNSNSQKVLGGNLGGGCQNCAVVNNDQFVATTSVCFQVQQCYNNEITGINQNIVGNGSGTVSSTSYGLTDSSGLRSHTQAVEDENGNLGHFTVYNNYIHDNTAGINIEVAYNGSQVYNNVLSNNSLNKPIQIWAGGGDSSTDRGYVYNNTIDCTANNVAPISVEPSSDGTTSIAGIVTVQNNITINCIPISNTVSGTVTISNNFNNPSMQLSEASNYGFIEANKYSPSSVDPNVSGQGLNLTSSCISNLAALCSDTSGAFWFGGSPKARPTGSAKWDYGAFYGLGGASGPPTATVTAPANNAIVSGTSVTLTATCVPVSPATCASVQFFVDGISFGAALTSSPYTTTLDSTKISNGSHTIYVVATDSNSNTNTSGTVTVTVNNSISGCFVTNPTAATSQGFTSQAGTFTATVSIIPNSTGTNDTVVGLASSAATTYSQLSTLLRSNTSGFWDAFNGATSSYTAANSAPYVGGTTYIFSWTVNVVAGTYSVTETSPSNIVIASGYTFRATATNLAFLVGLSDAGVYDTATVCNFQIGAATTVTVSPSSFDFGSITENTTASQTFSVTSSGGNTTYSNVAISGSADFTVFSQNCTASPNTSCAPVIHFTPTGVGLETATLNFTDNATGSPQSVLLQGTGVAAAPSLSLSQNSLAFGNVQVYTTHTAGPVVITITNGPVTFSSIAPSGGNAADFSIASNSTCAVGTISTPTCQITMNFTPTTLTAESTTLVITSNASNSPQTVTLTGTGVPFISVAPLPQVMLN